MVMVGVKRVGVALAGLVGKTVAGPGIVGDSARVGRMVSDEENVGVGVVVGMPIRLLIHSTRNPIR